MFHAIFYQPIFNLLIWLYAMVGDIGVAIILLTVILKLLLWPLTIQSLRSQKMLQQLQPKLKALQEKYKDDKPALTKSTMELYKEEKVNPFSSCLPLLIQLPFLFALYRVLVDGLESKNFSALYPFVANPGTIHTISFGFLDLAKSSIILAGLAGAVQFWQAKMLPRPNVPPSAGPGSKDESTMAIMNKQMMFLAPAMTILIGSKLPGGLALYWLVMSLLTVVQQYLVFKKKQQE